MLLIPSRMEITVPSAVAAAGTNLPEINVIKNLVVENSGKCRILNLHEKTEKHSSLMYFYIVFFFNKTLLK